jgi:membrane-associated phospholipid phosphatase
LVVVLGLLLSARGGFGQGAPKGTVDQTKSGIQAVPPKKTLSVVESIKLLPSAIVQDQKPIWLFPVHAAQGRHWKPALALTLSAATLIALDPHDTAYFRRTSSFADFNNVVSGRNTMIGMAAVPATAFVLGLTRHDSYATKTALEAGEAAADAQILALEMKMITRRLRPSDISPQGDFGDTFFKSNSNLGINSSFPSGHAITAFAIATVFAERYRRHRWVPWVAFGAAALVGFSRDTLQAHFPSDIFTGAALGYSLSHFIVLRRD